MTELICKYNSFKTLGYSSWHCNVINGIVSQELCQNCCKYCSEANILEVEILEGSK